MYFSEVTRVCIIDMGGGGGGPQCLTSDLVPAAILHAENGDQTVDSAVEE